MNDYKFGIFLYEQRSAKGLSQAELGSMLGVSNKAVSKWESGVAKPQTDKLVRLAEILNVTVEELLLGERIPKKEVPCNGEPPTPTPKDTMLRQWLHTCRVAKIATWVLVSVLVQLPFVTGFLINVLHVSDDVGAAYVLCTILLLLISATVTVVYRVSASKQKKTLLRLFAIDPAILAKLTANQRKSPTPLEKIASEPSAAVSSSFRFKILQFEKQQLLFLKWWLIIAAVPVLIHVLLNLLSLTDAGWESFLLFVALIHISWSVFVVVLPLDTVISCILIWRIHKKLCADFPDEYRAYRKEKKRTATTQTKLQTVAVTLYGIMMIFSAFRIFSTPDSVVFWAAVVLFSVLFAGFIAVLCFRLRRVTKELTTYIQSNADQG